VPLTVANRLLGDWTAAALVVLDRTVKQERGCPLQAVLRDVEEELYRAGGPECGAVLLAPGRIEDGSGFQALVLDSTPAAARMRAERLELKLLRLIRETPATASTA
jgi:hypothetical protein